MGAGRLSVTGLVVSLAVCEVLFLASLPGWAGPAVEKVVADQPVEVASVSAIRQIGVIRLDGAFREGPGATFLSVAGGVKITNFADMTKRISQAAEDDELAGLLLSIDRPMLSWAQVDELRGAIDKVRQSGKKTYAYVEMVGAVNYLLACGCDEIAITPTGYLAVNGLGGQAVYFKDLLDKLGVEADLLQMGDYKSAAEPFMRRGPSEYELEQIDHLFDDLYSHLLESIGQSRHLTTEAVSEIIDNGPFTAVEAQEFGLVDVVAFRHDFLAELEGKEGGAVALKLDYGAPAKAVAPSDNFFGMMKALQQLFGPPAEPVGDAIAVVYVDGPINLGENTDGLGGTMIGSRTIRTAVAEASADKDVKAIVVRIDSPGGSATASDIIYNALRRAGQVKPVIASMGHVAASGGYYVACGAQTIIAEPSTITGSIGVVGGKFVIKGLLGKIGVNTYSFERGRNAQIFSSTRPFGPLERLKLMGQMRQFYEMFKKRVADSRGDRLTDSIDKLAEGRIYTGRQAQEAGLVDRLGGLAAAIELAAEAGQVEKYHLRILPRPKTFFEMLEDLLAASESSDGRPEAFRATANGSVEKFSGMGLPWSHLFGDPALRGALRHAAGLLRILQGQQMLLIMPYEIILNR